MRSRLEKLRHCWDEHGISCDEEEDNDVDDDGGDDDYSEMEVLKSREGKEEQNLFLLRRVEIRATVQ